MLSPLAKAGYFQTVGKVVVIWVLTCLLVSTLPLNNIASAHSGGTDRFGCHAGTEPYHCHNEGDSEGIDDAALVLFALMVIGFFVWNQTDMSFDSDEDRVLNDKDWHYRFGMEASNKALTFRYRF